MVTARRSVCGQRCPWHRIAGPTHGCLKGTLGGRLMGGSRGGAASSGAEASLSGIQNAEAASQGPALVLGKSGGP